MTESSYPWGEPFQLRLLALLRRHPQELSEIVEPSFFTSPMMVDIARILRDAYRKHPGVRLSRTTLRELVRTSLGRKGREHWPAYKSTLKKIFRVEIPDESILIAEAVKFARESRYRDALVAAERSVSAGNFENVHNIIEELCSFGTSNSARPWKWKTLPKYSDFPHSEIEWLVEGVVPSGSILALSGDEGVGNPIR